MSNYVIMTDTNCDIRIQTLADWGVKCVDMTFRNIKTNEEFSNGEVASADFYAEMRSGAVFQTSAVNPAVYKDAFEEEFRNGNDVVCIVFSSGLSVSRRSAELAAEEAAEGSPHRVIVVDSLCASAGQGLLVYLAVQKKKEGVSADELAAYLTGIVPKVCHWFTVDDLKYLKRGGRINAASAFAATVLDIKPVLHMDDAGHLVSVSKVRGRRQAIKALAGRYRQLADDPEKGVYFISHGDCLGDAELLEDMIGGDSGHKAASISDVGPVIGSHSGPGTLALFFIGKER